MEWIAAIGSLLMFLLLLSCSNNVCLLVLYFFKNPFVPLETKVNLCRAFCFMYFPSLIKRSLWSRLCSFCACSGKIVIQETKKISLIIYLHNHNLYFTCQNQKSNHALINPLNTLTLYSLPTLSSLCLKLEERGRWRSSRWSFLPTGGSWPSKSKPQISRRVSRKRHPLTKTGTRCYCNALVVIYLF